MPEVLGKYEIIETESFSSKRWASNHVQFDLLGRSKNAEYIALHITWEKLSERPRDCEPCFSLCPTQCQHLMDSLWTNGFRPSEGSGSAGALRQAEAHIDSLRKIAFALAGNNGHEALVPLSSLQVKSPTHPRH